MDTYNLRTAIPNLNEILTFLDSDPLTRGIGLVIYSEKKSEWIRNPRKNPPNEGKFLLLELRNSSIQYNENAIKNRTINNLYLPNDVSVNTFYASNPPSQKPKFNLQTPRDTSSNPLKEWAGAGINCSAAGLAWLGVVAFSAAAPVTGGASLVPTLMVWGGAMAATAQCVNSSYRVANLMNGRENINESLDQSTIYISVMYMLDILSLSTGVGAIRYFRRTSPSMIEAGADRFRLSQTLSKHQQRHLAFELGSRMAATEEVSTAAINAVLQKRLLDTLGAGAAIGGSLHSGTLKDIVVWMVEN